MELLDKIAGRILLDYGGQATQKRIRPRQITLEQIRLLLFKECDWRGRKLLFDSASIQKVPSHKDDRPNIGKEDEGPCIMEVSQGFTYLYKGPVADASVIGEMIFGAVAMSYKGVSLKIHIVDEPTRIMCSKVFCVPSSRRISSTDRKGSDMDWRNSANTLSVPMFKELSVPYSFSLDRGDSGFCGDQSPYSSIGSTHDYFSMWDFWDGNSQEDFVFHSPPGRKLSASSNGSWQRRSFQSAATRFALGHTPPRLLSVPTGASNLTTWDSQVYTSSSASDTSASLASAGSERRRSKLGLALLITANDPHQMEEVRRCVEHSQQLQALVCRLRLAALTAGAGERFVSTLHAAAADAARWLSDLLYGPRLQPAWLGLATAEPLAAPARADELLANLCCVLTQADTKHTNFFISTLVTHVLTYHLGWVTTVSPYDTLDPQKQSDNSCEPKRPYNALWAQLTDLCGAIGVPPRAARTIISGTSHTFLNTLLTVLTYFVRCGEVTKTDFQYQDCEVKETKVISVNIDSDKEDHVKTVNSVTVPETSGLKRTKTANKLDDNSADCLLVPSSNVQDDSSTSTLVEDKYKDSSMVRSSTQASLNRQLSSSDCIGQLKRKPTMLLPIQASLDSSLTSNSDEEPEQNVIFVLGDNEKLVGLKNKSNDGTRVKKSSKIHNEPLDPDLLQSDPNGCSEKDCVNKPPESGSKCCSQTLQHSKQIKHSGFKFEFDKYPQIVTNYMKSKNLEILDRHYIGKPGNLKLDNFQFDPTVVPPIQEEKCETCYKCLQMESLLQTPTNASEMEYMADMPRPIEPQHAKESIVQETSREMSPKTFVRRKEENTLVVNVKDTKEGEKVSDPKASGSKELSRLEARRAERARDKHRVVRVNQVLEFPMPSVDLLDGVQKIRAGFDMSLLGGVTDHYVPDLILQGTKSCPESWENELRRDLELSTYLNKSLSAPIQAVAIIGDINSWEVRVVGRDCGTAGMSSLVGAMLEALPAMCRANVPAQQCLSFLESKLREVCVLSKTLADMLMSTDFCDIVTLTKSLNIDVNDVPLLLAVATTHTPQVVTRYGISYR